MVKETTVRDLQVSHGINNVTGRHVSHYMGR